MSSSESTARSLVKANGLTKYFPGRRRLMGGSAPIRALDEVDLEIQEGQTLALVGPSGSGKSTLARCLLGVEQPTSGQVWFDGIDLLRLNGAELQRLRSRMQMVFQDAARAMNPRWGAADIVAEPLLVQRRGTANEQRRLSIELMERVGLGHELADRSPLEMSGGQRQRLAIARALVLGPQFIVFDETLSALDRSVQAQISNLLLELQKERNLTYLLIAHDMSLVDHFADEIAVISSGRIVMRAAATSLTPQALLVALLERSGSIAGGVRGDSGEVEGV